MKTFDGDVDDYSRLVLAQRAPDSGGRDLPAKSAHARELARPRRDLAPLRKEIAAVEEKMRRFEDLLRQVDEALAEAGAGGEAAKIADLASKRSELERALTAAEENWLDLASQVERAG